MFKDKGINMDLHYKFNQQIYDPESIKGKFRMKKFLRIFAEYLKGLKGKALDVGCGMGISTFALEKVGFQPTGVDTSERFIRKAKDIALKKQLRSKFYNIKAKDIDTLKQVFSVTVFMGNPLPHFSFDSLDTIIRKSWNVINIDGIILFHYIDWVYILFSEYKKTLVEKNQENKIMLSIHSTLDTKTGVFERVFFLPEKGEFFTGRFHIWSPWLLEYLLRKNRFKNIESHNLEGQMWVTRAIR